MTQQIVKQLISSREDQAECVSKQNIMDSRSIFHQLDKIDILDLFKFVSFKKKRKVML